MAVLLNRLWREDEGQDVAEYAVMLAVVLVIVVGTVKMVGANASNVFSSVASGIHLFRRLEAASPGSCSAVHQML